MANEGFEITSNLCNLETAFMAQWGEGKPIIGIVGEFDALPNLNQECDVLEKKSTENQKFGHGCGHNLLGSASMQAAVAVKDYLQKNNITGTIRYYATPGEEGGSGKTFMLRDGCFLDLDICISWHPNCTYTCGGSSLANILVFFDFSGKSAHAAQSPELGRSALDAVELMNVGANYLREHIIQEARVHYAVTNSGGDAPNTVQAQAQVLYAIRAPKNVQIVDIYERICDVAKGAALMTGTTVEIRPVSYYADCLDNNTLNEIVYRNMQEIIDIDYTDEELRYAAQYQALAPVQNVNRIKDEAKKYGQQNPDSPMATYLTKPGIPTPASTDLGNISWNVPTAFFSTACFAIGTPLHTWLAVAQGKSSIAHKGMKNAALVMALTAVQLFENQYLIEQAKNDFENAKDGEKYQCLLPDDVKAGSF